MIERLNMNKFVKLLSMGNLICLNRYRPISAMMDRNLGDISASSVK